jgi:diguanylate cyclase
MLFRRRESEPNSVQPAATEEAPAASEADKALDTVTALLRIYGEHAFDTDEFDAAALNQECEAWALRLALGSRESSQAGPSSGAGSRRDFVGVRRFVKEKRKVEGEYVARSMSNLRQAIRTFAQCLTSALNEDQQSDRNVESRLVNLSTALSDRDTERVRHEAAAVVASVRQAIQGRRRREQQHIQELAERLRSLRSELSEVRTLAATDALTKLGNRAAFDEHLERLADLGLLFGHPPCLLMIDLDHFKAVNDEYGHQGGDSVLREVANTLTRTFLRKQDFLCRYGGEEFAILLVDTDLAGARALAERALKGLRQNPVSYLDKRIPITASMGLTTLTPGEGARDWSRRADELLYQAKNQGRDRLVVG